MRLVSAGRWLLELLGEFTRRLMERASGENSVQTRLNVPPQEFRRRQTGHLLNIGGPTVAREGEENKRLEAQLILKG